MIREKGIGMQKYSVLMSVYVKDKPEYLKLAINSMLNQTVPPDQFVIVIDGPVPENLMNIINEKKRENKGLFTVIPLKENGGLGNALNEGIRLCRNELVARMDSDDISLPKRCEKELECFEKNSELVICGCNIDEFYENTENIRISRVVPETYEAIKHFMRRRQPFNHPTVMYKKSKVIESGGYVSLPRKEDFDLFSRMLSKGYYALNIAESLYLYRADEDNYTRRKSWENFKSAVYVYVRHYKRCGCSVGELCEIIIGEFLFLLMPTNCMKFVSDNLLRKRVKI